MGNWSAVRVGLFDDSNFTSADVLFTIDKIMVEYIICGNWYTKLKIPCST